MTHNLRIIYLFKYRYLVKWLRLTFTFTFTSVILIFFVLVPMLPKIWMRDMWRRSGDITFLSSFISFSVVKGSFMMQVGEMFGRIVCFIRGWYSRVFRRVWFGHWWTTQHVQPEARQRERRAVLIHDFFCSVCGL